MHLQCNKDKLVERKNDKNAELKISSRCQMVTVHRLGFA